MYILTTGCIVIQTCKLLTLYIDDDEKNSKSDQIDHAIPKVTSRGH